jgi:acylglycerol lipase
MRNKYRILVPAIAFCCVSARMTAIAQEHSTVEPGKTWTVADAETPPAPCQQPAPKRDYTTPTSSTYDRYATPQYQPTNNSSSSTYDRYATPQYQPTNNSSSSTYDRYATPQYQPINNSPSSTYDRYATPQYHPTNNSPSSTYDRYATPQYQPTNNSPSKNSSANQQNLPSGLSLVTGDIAADNDPGLLGVMFLQEEQPEIVKVAADPPDKAVIDNIKNLEKSANETTKDTFTPVASQAESLGACLADGGTQIAEAATCFDIAYKTRSRFVPPLDPSLLSPSLGLASSAFGGDNFESAINWYQQSLEILEKWTPKDPAEKDAALAKCLGGLAGSYLAQADGKSALPYAKRMYDLVKAKYGAQSAQTCWGAATLGECYRILRMNEQKPLQDEMFDICLAKEGGPKRFSSMKPGTGRNSISRAGGYLIQESLSPLATSGNELSGTNQTFSQEVPVRFWFPTAAVPRAVVICIHGMCLHSGSYSALAGSLQSRGYLVIALDVRGCGTWKNSFGQNFLNLDGTLSDIQNIVARIHGLLPKTPIFLLGESMGGGIALHASARNPENLAGVISSVPGASRFDSAKEALMVILHLPFGLNNPINIGKSLLQKATGNAQLRDVWKSDPLSRKTLSPKELIAFQLFMSENGKYAFRIKSKPVLVIQGMDDRLVKPPSTLKLYKRVASPNKTLLKVNSGEHLTFEMNQCTPPVLEQLVKWVDRNSH